MNDVDSAADWFAKMHGPGASDEREAFAQWYAVPANAAAYDHLVRTWDQAKFLANTPTGRARSLDRIHASRGSSGRVIALGAAMFLAAALGVALIGHGDLSSDRGRPAPSRTELVSAAAGQRTVRLADGSRVILGRGSRLAIAFSGNERRLHLLAGRARFDVSHDPARPFVVDAGGGSVVAHGTMFDITLAPRGIEVVLLRGAVDVRGNRPGRTAPDVRHLAPGQKVALVGGALGEPVAASALDTRWLDTMIEFEATPLDAAVAAFNRGGRRAIRVAGVDGRHFLVTGAFRRDDPEGFAATLAATFDLAVRRDGGAELVIARPPAPASGKKP